MIRAGFWEKVRARGLAGIVKAAYGIVKAAYRRAFDNPNSYLKRVIIPNPIDQNPWAHWRSPMDMMRQGWSTSLFHAAQQWSTRSS
jgi:hypothetical protein